MVSSRPMKLPSLINGAAMEIYSVARALPGVERLRLNVSRGFDSDSRYIRINAGCGNASVIRVSSHPAPDDNYDLNLLVHNDHERDRAVERASAWLKENYGT